MSPEDFLNWIQGVNNEAAGRLDSAGITGNARVLAEAELRNMSVIYAILYRDLVEEAYDRQGERIAYHEDEEARPAREFAHA